MRRVKDKYDEYSEEITRCSQLLSLWLIVKDDKLYGRIAVRWPQHGRKVAVTLCMYPQNNTCSYVIFDCERVSGTAKKRR